MLEAVNSVLSNAQLLKTSQTDGASQKDPVRRSDYVNVESANYASRNVKLDVASPRPILQIRDTSTGQSVRQFPTEGQIRAYSKAQISQGAQEASDVGQIEPSAVEVKAQIEQSPDIVKPEAVQSSVEVGGNVSEEV